MKPFVTIIHLFLLAGSLYAAEYHVSPSGLDANEGSQLAPFKTITAAAQVAQPGDTITVHAGIYREQVNPPRGGTGDNQRITYRAAAGETVVIKGSEVVTGWEKVQHDTWRVQLPNSTFGTYNPYQVTVSGDWFEPLGGKDRVYHTGEVYLNGHWLKEAASRAAVLEPAGADPLWFAEVDSEQTTIHAQFAGVDPNQQTVEINFREAVFYPEEPGVNYITVRGFTLEHAANNWAPPTAEQVGLIGTHWSKGWVIEDNTIRYAKCTGITLGKYGDAWDNDAQSAEGYVGTINRAVENGWSKANIGSHLVRNNHVSHCEQAGIVGSMGAVFSTVTGNTIHEINMRGLFGGAEMAGIKFHGPIDTTISHNHIYRCGGYGGIWLDWMSQGARVTGNLLHDNNRHDLFMEVNHGPFLVDNNIFFSGTNLLESSGGGAYAHNLFHGRIRLRREGRREVPYHRPHSTEILGLTKIVGDDERFHNNLFAGDQGLSIYDAWAPEHLQAAGNVYLAGSRPSRQDHNELIDVNFDPEVKLIQDKDGWWLKMAINPAWAIKRETVTTATLGKAIIPDAAFEQADGTPYRLDTDYFDATRSADNPAPGPLRSTDQTQIYLKVWPKVRLSAYEQWIFDHAGSTADVNGVLAFDADFDADGLPNGYEYILGLDPRVSDTDSPRKLNFQLMEDRATLSLTLAASYMASVTIRLQSSDTLEPGSWSTIATRDPSTGWSGPAAVTEVPAGGTFAVEIVDPTASPSGRFYRLSMTETPR